MHRVPTNCVPKTNIKDSLFVSVFEVISVIVVLNMLIATMSNTFQRVINNVNTEWTFGRTEVSFTCT